MVRARGRVAVRAGGRGGGVCGAAMGEQPRGGVWGEVVDTGRRWEAEWLDVVRAAPAWEGARRARGWVVEGEHGRVERLEGLAPEGDCARAVALLTPAEEEECAYCAHEESEEEGA